MPSWFVFVLAASTAQGKRLSSTFLAHQAAHNEISQQATMRSDNFNHHRLRGGSAGAATNVVSDYRTMSLVNMIVSRGGWLAVFLLSLSLTSVVMSGFEDTLAHQIELAYFVPLLIGHGGNAGGQTVGTVLGALSSGQVELKDWASVIIKEALAGLGAGSLTCIAVLPLLAAMKISRPVSAAILVTMPTLTVMASALGAALPFLVAALGADPAVVAGKHPSKKNNSFK